MRTLHVALGSKISKTHAMAVSPCLGSMCSSAALVKQQDETQPATSVALGGLRAPPRYCMVSNGMRDSSEVYVA